MYVSVLYSILLCLTTLMSLSLAPWFTAVCLSHAKPAMLSPDLGVTKQSPYPLLWEHEVKGTAAYDRHLLTSWPLSLLIHMNHHHRLHVADKDTLPLKYIIHRIHPLGRQPVHKVLCKEKKKGDCLWYLQYSALANHLTTQTVRFLESAVPRPAFKNHIRSQGWKL